MSEEKFYCSERIKDLIDPEIFQELSSKKEENNALKIFGDFFSYSRTRNLLGVFVDKVFAKSLILLSAKEATYSYMGIKFFLDTKNLEISKSDEKFLVLVGVIDLQEEDSYE